MLTVSLSGSDTDIGAKDDAALVPISGFHTDVDTLLNYKHKTGRATFEAIGRSVLSYAPSSIETLTTTYDQGQLAFSMIAGHNRFQATQMVNYSPYYQFGALPDATPSSLTETAQSHGDFANSKVSAVVSTTGVDFGRTISRRDTLSFSYNLRRTTFGGENLDLTYQGGGVVFLHRLSRSVALRTGYRYRSSTSTFTQVGSVHNHDLDFGLDYNRALGSSKRTTLAFSSGSSATPQDQGGMVFNLIGNAALTRQIGRTWRARLAANRSVEPLEGFTQSVLTNSGIFDVEGKLNRRVTFSTSVGYSMGTVGVTARDATSYDNWSATTGLRLMLSRWTALDAQYSAYGHRFEQGVQLAPGVMNALNRQGVRVSFTWLHPVQQ